MTWYINIHIIQANFWLRRPLRHFMTSHRRSSKADFGARAVLSMVTRGSPICNMTRMRLRGTCLRYVLILQAGTVDVYHISTTPITCMQFDIARKTFIRQFNSTYCWGLFLSAYDRNTILCLGESTLLQQSELSKPLLSRTWCSRQCHGKFKRRHY
jgi:hypothetical protein